MTASNFKTAVEKNGLLMSFKINDRGQSMAAGKGLQLQQTDNTVKLQPENVVLAAKLPQLFVPFPLDRTE